MQNIVENLVIKPKELKYILLILTISLLFIFSGGYFLGKKRMLEEIALQYEDECFADKIQQSLLLLCEQPERDEWHSSAFSEEMARKNNNNNANNDEVH